jgi:Zn-dependent peptidase ImmA (M78 family)
VRYDRRALNEEAMLRAAETRHQAQLSIDQPICVYDLCAKLNVIVRFNDISMEGMYDRLPRPRIHLSARRPLGRRAFNCAHELGHHLFGHGSTIDELRRDGPGPTYSDPREYLADTFAGHLLMPILGIGYAFTQRGWSPPKATRAQLFTIACHFGVGYAALVTHLVYALREIPMERLRELSKPLERIRREILGYNEGSRLIVVDDHWLSSTVDLEVGALLWLPSESVVTGDVVSEEYNRLGHRLFRGVKQGTCQALLPTGRAVTLRVSRYQFVGLAQYRHLSDSDEE